MTKTDDTAVRKIARKVDRLSKHADAIRARACHSPQDYTSAGTDLAAVLGKIEVLSDLFEELTGEIASPPAIAEALA